MHGDIPFVYDPYVFWKMGSYQNVTLTTEVFILKNNRAVFFNNQILSDASNG